MVLGRPEIRHAARYPPDLNPGHGHTHRRLGEAARERGQLDEDVRRGSEIGKLARERPGSACILENDFDGQKYAMRPATRPISILGTVILIDGSEKLLVKEGSSMKMYGVDPKSANWLVDGAEPPASSKTTLTARNTPCGPLPARSQSWAQSYSSTARRSCS